MPNCLLCRLFSGGGTIVLPFFADCCGYFFARLPWIQCIRPMAQAQDVCHRNQGLMSELSRCPFAVPPDTGARLGRRKAVPLDNPRAIDVKSPDLYATDSQHAVFRQLRQQSPIYWNPEADSTGFWAITTYKDVLLILQDALTFSPA